MENDGFTLIILLLLIVVLVFVIRFAIKSHKEDLERKAEEEVEKQNREKLLANKMFQTIYSGGVPHIDEGCFVLLRVDEGLHITPASGYYFDHYGVPFGTKEFQARWDEERTFSIPLENIFNVRYDESQHMTQETKGVLSKALVGGALLGPIGSIAGGLSGFKSTTQNYGMLIIEYQDDVGMKNTAVFYERDFSRQTQLKKFCNIIISARYDRLKALRGAS